MPVDTPLPYQPDQRRVFRLTPADAGFALAILVLVIAASVASDAFLTERNLTNIARQIVTNGLLSLGMLIVILTGGIDLSVGPVVAFAGLLSIGLQTYMPWPLAAGVALLMGLAVGALMALREHGIRVPEEVKLVGYDNISLTQYTSPPISTIHQNKWELGRTAAEVLLGMIHGTPVGRTSHITMDVQLVRRESTSR